MQRRKIYTNVYGIWLCGLNFKRGSLIYNSTIDIEYEKSYINTTFHYRLYLRTLERVSFDSFFVNYYCIRRGNLKFLKYLLYCICSAISAAVGGPWEDSTYKDMIIGVILIAIALVLWGGVYLILKYRTYLSEWKVILLTLLIWVGFIVLFCVGVILIELIIRK